MKSACSPGDTCAGSYQKDIKGFFVLAIILQASGSLPSRRLGKRLVGDACFVRKIAHVSQTTVGGIKNASLFWHPIFLFFPRKVPMKFSLVMTAALLATGLVSTAGAQTLQKVADANKITVSYREASVPFSYLIGSKTAIGFSVELVDAIVDDVRKKTKKPNLEVAYMAVTSQNRIPLMVNGTIDIECGSTTNNSTRAKDVTFSTNIFYTGTRLLTKKDSGIKNYADLAGKTVASTTGTTNAQVIRKYSADKKLDMQIVLGKDHDDSLLLVENDRAKAFAMDDILLFGLRANSKNPAALEVVGDSLQVEPYACFMRKDDPEFKALVDATLARLMKTGEFNRLYTKWFMSPIPPKGVNLNLPMSAELKDNLKALSDKPAM
jgi:ABC-type amino acid transport substrate-binding protein